MYHRDGAWEKEEDYFITPFFFDSFNSFPLPSHLGSIDEVEDFLHKIVQENSFTEAETQVPGKYKFRDVCSFVILKKNCLKISKA